MYFYHYFSKEIGPFHSISELPEEEAKKIWSNMIDHLEKMSGIDFKRNDDTMIVRRHEVRRIIESDMYQQFIGKDGIAERKYPYYMKLRNKEIPDKADIDFYLNGDFLKIPVEEFDLSTISFTYGDSMQFLDPAQFFNSVPSAEGKHWIKIYTYAEILEIIDKYGWQHDFGQGKPNFIEAQLWSEEQVKRYKYSLTNIK